MDLLISFIIAIIWGIVPFVIKYLSMEIPTDLILLVMAFIWFLVSIIYSLFLNKQYFLRNLKCFKIKSILIIFSIAFIGLFLKNILYVYVIEKSKRLNLAIAIMSLSSIVSLFYAIYVYKLKLTNIQTFGILLIGITLFVLLLTK